MNSRRLIAFPPRGLRTLIVAVQTYNGKGPTPVRFGSKADICTAPAHVRFTPNSDRESGLPAKVMSALPPKADVCGATGDVRYGPIADMAISNRSPHRHGQSAREER